MCRASAKRTCRSYCCKLSEQSPRNNNFRYAHQKIQRRVYRRKYFPKTKRRNSDFLPTVEISHLNAGQNSTTNEFLHQVFQQHQLDLVPEIELTSNDLLIDLARIGLGIAFVPDYCISPDSEDVFILHTKEELPERELAIAYNEHLPLSRASMEFLSYFRDKTC